MSSEDPVPFCYHNETEKDVSEVGTRMEFKTPEIRFSFGTGFLNEFEYSSLGSVPHRQKSDP